MNVYRLITLGMTYLVATSALAQWQWTDKDGRKVFSDRPPPSDILEKNILKRPGGRSGVAQSPPAPTESNSVTAAKKTNDSPQLSGVDKELLEKKKQADDAAVAKKKAEEEKVLKARVENCTRAKQAKATFDSGVRVARTNEKGERVVMDEAARAEEMKRIESIVVFDCR
jgi:type IV secretory pathway VirB10-like protein